MRIVSIPAPSRHQSHYFSRVDEWNDYTSRRSGWCGRIEVLNIVFCFGATASLHHFFVLHTKKLNAHSSQSFSHTIHTGEMSHLRAAHHIISHVMHVYIAAWCSAECCVLPFDVRYVPTFRRRGLSFTPAWQMDGWMYRTVPLFVGASDRHPFMCCRLFYARGTGYTMISTPMRGLAPTENHQEFRKQAHKLQKDSRMQRPECTNNN